MSSDSYSEINLHIVWHTKNSAPLLTPELEKVAHADIRDRIFKTPGAFFHEIGGTETHVHVAISIPPTLTISTFIGELKGASSHTINQRFPGRDERFAWQVGYGVVSFGTRDLPWVKRYIQKQKEHHAANKTHDRLERITEVEQPADDGPVPPEDAGPDTKKPAGPGRTESGGHVLGPPDGPADGDVGDRPAAGRP